MTILGNLIYTQTLSALVLAIAFLWIFIETNYYLQELDNIIHEITETEEKISRFWHKPVITMRFFSIGTILSYLVLVGYYQ